MQWKSKYPKHCVQTQGPDIKTALKTSRAYNSLSSSYLTSRQLEPYQGIRREKWSRRTAGAPEGRGHPGGHQRGCGNSGSGPGGQTRMADAPASHAGTHPCLQQPSFGINHSLISGPFVIRQLFSRTSPLKSSPPKNPITPALLVKNISVRLSTGSEQCSAIILSRLFLGAPVISIQ